MSNHPHEARSTAENELNDAAETGTPANAPAADGSTAHIRNPDGTPLDNPSG
jgi:hypothetical protein